MQKLLCVLMFGMMFGLDDLNLPNFTYQGNYNGQYYYLSNYTDSWENAQSMCENHGGSLVVINDAVENEAVYQFLFNNGAGNSWLGMSDINDEGFWETVHGDQIWIGVTDGIAVNESYTNWGVNEPNNVGGGQDCGLIGNNGYWDDYYCSGNNNIYFMIEFWVDGCSDPEACNYDETATVDNGSCVYAMTNYDCDGNCISNFDCAGLCAGTSQFDECGICNGDNSSCLDCEGVVNGYAEIDDFGICQGQNQSFQGYIQHGFKFNLHEGANLLSCPCFNETPIEDVIPSDILDIITGIITEGGACSQIAPDIWVGSSCDIGGGKGYWFISNGDGEFNYTCSEN